MISPDLERFMERAKRCHEQELDAFAAEVRASSLSSIDVALVREALVATGTTEAGHRLRHQKRALLELIRLEKFEAEREALRPHITRLLEKHPAAKVALWLVGTFAAALIAQLVSRLVPSGVP